MDLEVSITSSTLRLTLESGGPGAGTEDHGKVDRGLVWRKQGLRAACPRGHLLPALWIDIFRLLKS